jgi:hypothetical protein
LKDPILALKYKKWKNAFSKLWWSQRGSHSKFFRGAVALLLLIPFYIEADSNRVFDLGRHSPTQFYYSVSSGWEGKYRALNLFDSQPNTVWMSERRDQPEWILVDFQEKRLINRFEIKFPSWGFFRSIGRYEIQVNVWGEWRPIITNDSPERVNIHLIPGIDASMIRLYFPDTENMPVSVSDFRILLNNSLLNGIDSRLTGFQFPIENGILPRTDYALPGAPRAYRNGIHKGVDLSEIHKGFLFGIQPVTFDTEILSIQEGEVVRADWDYLPMEPKDFERQKELTARHPVTFVDRDFGGRQVWIDHGNGILSAYNHLSWIHPSIQVGKKLKKGQVIGKAGNSGLQGEAERSDKGVHLHLEIWVDGEYLGKGLKPSQSRTILEILFGIYPPYL